MMSRILAAVGFAAVVATACANHESDAGLGKDYTYPMTATIVSRDPAKNTVNLANKEVPGVMAAMTMDYEVRGAKVSALPPDGTAVDVTIHDRDGAYYITDVKAKK
jgi:Cu/Ag efflux protein CusF